MDFVDEYGNPTAEAIALIENWSSSDIYGWFEFIFFIWQFPEWGWYEGVEGRSYRYHLHTNDVASNERLIEAMQRNIVLWTLTWFQSQRGGYYIFEVSDYEN